MNNDLIRRDCIVGEIGVDVCAKVVKIYVPGLSFYRNPEAVLHMKSFLNENGRNNVPIYTCICYMQDVQACTYIHAYYYKFPLVLSDFKYFPISDNGL